MPNLASNGRRVRPKDVALALGLSVPTEEEIATLINKQVNRGIESCFRRGKDEVTLGLMNIAGGRY